MAGQQRSSWAAGGGEMAALIGQHDWAATPLGAIETWPQSLKSVVDLMMANQVANILVYGPERVLIYNDACVALYGSKHPKALGRSGPEVFPELWDEIGPLYDRVFAGEALRFEAQPWTFDRGAAPRGLYDAYFTPGRDESGAVAFAHVTAIEITDRVAAEAALRESEERQAFLLKLSDILRRLTAPNDIKAAAMRVLGEHLGISRAQYHEVDGSGEYYSADGIGYAKGLPLLDLKYRIDQFGSFVAEDFEAGRPFRSDDLLADPRPTAEEREAYGFYQIRAGAGIPLLRGSKLVAVLAVHDMRPHPWTDLEMELIRETAERIWTAVERNRAEAALRQSEERYRALFDSIDEGLAIVEMIYDDTGEIVDMIFRQVNRAYERQGGVYDVVGRSVLEVLPGMEDYWFNLYRKVAKTGEPERVQNYQQDVDRWFDVYFSRIDENGRFVAIVFNDITGRKRAEIVLRESEERQAFMLKLSDALRAEPDVDAVTDRALRMLFKQLGLDRCYTAVYRLADDRADFTHQVGNDRVPLLPDGIRLSDFPEAFRVVFDRTLVIEDVAETQGLSDTDRRNMEGLGMRALLAATLRKGENSPLWVVVAVSARPRRWTGGEIALVEEVAERTWAALERARAERALRENEARQRHIIDSAVEYAIVTMDANRTVTGWNTGAERILGYAEAEIVGQPGDVFFTPEDRARGEPEKEQRKAGETGRAANERWHLRKDGSRFWGSGVMLPITDGEDGDFLKIFRDRTEEREAEEKIRRREGELARVQEIGGVGGIEVDVDGGYRGRRSPEYLRLHGLTEASAEESHEDWLARVHPADRKQADKTFRDSLASGDPVYSSEYRIIRPDDGEVRWIMARADIERDPAGRPLRVVGAHIDVTERKLIEEERARTESRLRALMEGIPQLVWRAEGAGQWTWSSPQWQDYTGQSEEASRGLGWLDALHRDDREQARKAWAKAQRSGRLEVEYRVHHVAEGRHRWFQTRATPVRDALGSIVEWLGTSTDIDELRQLQEEQKVLVAELQHRTRNLIAVVRSTATQTLASTKSLPEFRSAFNDRLAALSRVQGFLSRPEQEPLTIGGLVQLEMDALGGDVEPDRIVLEGPEVPLRAASVQILALALHELATNARKYGALAGDGGRLVVTWHVQDAGEGRRLVLDWAERGVDGAGETGAPPRRGYGRELIERALPYTLGAETRFELTPDGVRCRIDLPLAARDAPGKR